MRFTKQILEFLFMKQTRVESKQRVRDRVTLCACAAHQHESRHMQDLTPWRSEQNRSKTWTLAQSYIQPEQPSFRAPHTLHTVSTHTYTCSYHCPLHLLLHQQPAIYIKG